jgi:23S rRNA (adenine2030-N6)-methyltransferase
VNYRHAFHAGNFADVHKHVVLLALIDRLQRKPKPIFYLDTHAGRGWYDLRSDEALRGDEAEGGIGRLRSQAVSHPDLQRYVASVGEEAGVRYAGSPILAVKAMRAGDRCVFVEKQLEEAAALQQSLHNRRGVSVVHGDGYAALKTYLPPRENREFQEVLRALQFSVQRWAGGVYAIWYPLKATPEVPRFHAALKASGLRKLLRLELCVRPEDSPLGLNGSGMLIANPPWQLDTDLLPALTELHRALSLENEGGVRVDWLVPE